MASGCSTHRFLLEANVSALCECIFKYKPTEFSSNMNSHPVKWKVNKIFDKMHENKNENIKKFGI